MQCIGGIRSGIVSLAADVAGGATVVSLDETGIVHLWDTRCRQPKPPTFAQAKCAADEDASEIAYFSETHRAVALCGSHVHVVDLRSAASAVETYTHHAEVVQLLPRTAEQLDSDELLLVDEDGFMFPFQLSAAKPRATLHKSILGQQYDLSSHAHPEHANVFGFGALTNYCSGVTVLSNAAAGVVPHLFTIGMDSAGALYKSPDSAVPFELPQDQAAQTLSAQMINPPLPNCVASCGAQLAVGKANGVYSVFELDAENDLAELLVAPGDAMNGLIYVDWVGGAGPRSLLTLSLCGDVTVWQVGAFLAESDVDEEQVDALPEVEAALSLREFLGPAGSAVYANTCCAIPQSSRYVLGDTRGHLLLFDVASGS